MSKLSFTPMIDGKHIVDDDGNTVTVDIDTEAQAKNVEVEVAVDGELLQSNYLLPDAVYNALKWIALLLLPTCAWLITALSGVWDIPMAEQISMSLNILGTFIAVLIGVSTLQNTYR